MGFSKEWETIYKKGQQLSVWPWSDLVSYVMRYTRPRERNLRVLELGCGAGANIPFFEWLHAEYYALDGSESIVQQLKDRFPEYSSNINVGDFTGKIDLPIPFDLIVDRAAVTHNTTEAIIRTIHNIDNLLKPAGFYIGVDWFSKTHSDFYLGEPIDEYTKRNIDKGQFHNVGAVHFSDEEHLKKLFENFELIVLEHKMVQNVINEGGHTFAAWNIVARKKAEGG